MPAGVTPGRGQSYKDNGGQMARPYGPCVHVDQSLERTCFPSQISSRMSEPRDRTQVSRIAGICFIVWATREAAFRDRWVQLVILRSSVG